MTTRLECPICRAGGRVRGKGDWRACRACGTSFRAQSVTAADLENYYREAFRSDQRPMYATGPRIAGQYARLIEQGVTGFTWASSRILDYGAGEGHFTRRLRALGAEVVAVEPYGGPPAESQDGADHRSLEELAGEAPFDGIVMTEVIEHLPDPVSVVRRLRAHLKEDGWIFVTTPNIASLKARVLRGGWSEKQKQGHLYLFSRDGLKRGLQEAGFGQVAACRGSVRFSSGTGRHIVQHLLQRLRLDGQLRVIARNNG